MGKTFNKVMSYSELGFMFPKEKKTGLDAPEPKMTPDELAAHADEQEERKRRSMLGRRSTDLTSPLGVGTANTGATLLSGK